MKRCLDCGAQISSTPRNRLRCRPCAKKRISRRAYNLTDEQSAIVKHCLDCGAQISSTPRNRLRCRPCANLRISRPAHNLTDEQSAIVKRLAGIQSKIQIAKEVGASVRAVERLAKSKNISLRVHRYKPEVIREVTRCYERCGRQEVAKRYPGLNLRSILQRRSFEPRRLIWKKDEIIAVVRASGLLSQAEIAAILNRPNAEKGSVASLWKRRLKGKADNVNGIPLSYAKQLIEPHCPIYQTKAYSTECRNGKKLVLWVDFSRYLKSDVPCEIKRAVDVLAKFQRWLHRNNVATSVNRILYEKELRK